MATDSCNHWTQTEREDWICDRFICIRQYDNSGYRLHFILDEPSSPMYWAIDGETRSLEECFARADQLLKEHP